MRKAHRKAERRSAESRINEIKDAARQEFIEKGYPNFQTGEVARRCGISEATIYHYFPTKRDLLVSIVEDWFTAIVAKPGDETASMSLFDRLRGIVADIFQTVRQHPEFTRFILLELRAAPEYPQSTVYKLNSRFTVRVAALISDGVQSGVFRNDISPRLIRSMIFGCMEHQTWGYLRGTGDFSVEESADGIASVIFRGLAVTEAAIGAVSTLDRMEEQVSDLHREIRELKGSLASAPGRREA